MVGSMATPATHEQFGNIDEPFVLTKQHHRAQQERARLRCDVTPLT